MTPAPEPTSAGTDQKPDRGGLDLFARRPADLLLSSDQQLLRTLGAIGEEANDTRRSTVNDYLHGLGREAVEFSSSFENATGVEGASLGDDLPGLAAFLASYRLVQQGRLSMDEAIQGAAARPGEPLAVVGRRSPGDHQRSDGHQRRRDG